MKKLLAGAILALAFPCLSFADIANFDTAQGWVDGNVLDAPAPGVQTGQTSGLNWTSNQNNSYTVDTATGTLNVPSTQFLRQLFDTGSGTGFDIPTGQTAIFNAQIDPSGLSAFTGNRILLEIGLTQPGDPFNATTGNASNGVQLRSDGTNWLVDAPAFGNNNPPPAAGTTPIALANGPLDLSLVYTETSATNVDLEVFLNGTSFYTATVAASGGGLYGWTNSSQGTGVAGDVLRFNSIELIVPSAIPEPSSLGLLGLGLAGFVSRRRRRS